MSVNSVSRVLSSAISVATGAKNWAQNPEIQKKALTCSGGIFGMGIGGAMAEIFGRRVLRSGLLGRAVGFGFGVGLGCAIGIIKMGCLAEEYIYPCTPPLNAVRCMHPQLDENLQTIAQEGNPEKCRQLIAQNADPNAVDSHGRTSLQIAIANQRWATCKALIDNGANWGRAEWMPIRKYLLDRKVHPYWHRTFMLPFPNPGELEIFIRGKFYPLAKIPLAERPSGTSGVALAYVCEEQPGRNYSALVHAFDDRCYSAFEKIAQHLTLVRARVIKFEQMQDVAARVENACFNLPLRLWILYGHGAADHVSIGPDSMFNGSDHELEALEPYIPLGADVIFRSCKAALGGCLAQRVSRKLRGRAVYASPRNVSVMDPTFYYLPSSKIPRCLPFLREENSPFYQIRAYVDGQEVASGSPSDGVKEKLIRFFAPEAALPVESSQQ